MSVTVAETRVDRVGGRQMHAHYRTVSSNPRPVIVFSHGFTVDGAESHRIFLRMAHRYNQVGYNTVNFDYYGSGYSDGDYSEFSVSSAVSDLNTMIEWVRERPESDPSSIVLHGQSLGTAIATVVTARRSDIRGCILWNLSADLYRRYSAMLGSDIFDMGYSWVADKGYMIRREFMEDIKQYDILSLFDDWEIPTLFVSSASDTKGEPRLAEAANEKAGRFGTRVVIDGANHSFKCQPELEEQAANASIDWVVTLLGDAGGPDK